MAWRNYRCASHAGLAFLIDLPTGFEVFLSLGCAFPLAALLSLSVQPLLSMYATS